MTLRYSARTHTGLVRTLNEDAILSLGDQGIWVVADGMGGHAAGDYASQTIVDTVAALPADLSPGDRMRMLREALLAAHRQIVAESARRGGATVGAAVVALLVTEGHFAAFWAGDCRLYRLRDGEIALLTSDHSVVGALVEAGELSWDEADLHPNSNAITRALGVGGDNPGLEKVRGGADPGDRFLLCSDGLNKYAGFSTLESVLRATPIETVSDRLIQIALDGGGGDNVSAIVVDVT